MADGEKYRINEGEGEFEILPNLLGITERREIEKAEAEGFIRAGYLLTTQLATDTRFDLAYVHNLHKVALGHLYKFAGRSRTVNLSKGGFSFPAAAFLDQSLNNFEIEILSRLFDSYNKQADFVQDLAKVHAEFLFIHPYREGNGRTARLLANLMAYKAGYDGLKFEKLDSKEMFDAYIHAVQQAGLKNYSPMKAIVEFIL